MKTIHYKTTALTLLLLLPPVLMSCVEEGTYDEFYLTENPNITFPTLSSVTIQDVSYCSASLKAMVISNGNLAITDAGFVLSTAPEPKFEDMRISCGAVETLSKQTDQLKANTTYYVRAYAQNERGLAMGAVSSFTTMEGTSLGRDGYDNDERLSDSSGGSIIDRDGFTDDEKLSDSSEGSNIGRDGFINEDDLNGSSGGSIIDRGDYDGDEDLNDSSGGSIIDRDGYDGDEDLNDSSGGSIIDREGYDGDENLNDSSGGSIIDRDGYDGDEDLNDSSGGSIIDREGYGEDENLNNSALVSVPVSKKNDNCENKKKTSIIILKSLKQ